MIVKALSDGMSFISSYFMFIVFVCSLIFPGRS